jgi:hypothetical protein
MTNVAFSATNVIQLGGEAGTPGRGARGRARWGGAPDARAGPGRAPGAGRGAG